jgi:hypothetical protein
MQSMACKDQRCWVNTPQTREGRTHERIAKIEKLRKRKDKLPKLSNQYPLIKMSWYILKVKWHLFFRLTRRRVIILLKQKRAIGPSNCFSGSGSGGFTKTQFFLRLLQCKSIIKMTRRKLLMTLWYLSYGRYTPGPSEPDHWSDAFAKALPVQDGTGGWDPVACRHSTEVGARKR